MVVAHTELVVGMVVGGKIGPMVTIAGASPSSTSPSLLSLHSALGHVMVLVSTHAGSSTSSNAVKTDPVDPADVTVGSAMVAPTASIRNTAIGTTTGPVISATGCSALGERCKPNTGMAATVAVSAIPHVGGRVTQLPTGPRKWAVTVVCPHPSCIPRESP